MNLTSTLSPPATLTLTLQTNPFRSTGHCVYVCMSETACCIVWAAQPARPSGCIRCGGKVSEENDDPILIDEAHRGDYCVVFDPLDGSSNIDCGVRCASCVSHVRPCSQLRCCVCYAHLPASDVSCIRS